MTELVPDCTCSSDGCDGEGYDPDDPRTCRYCLELDSEWPCPADMIDDDTL